MSDALSGLDAAAVASPGDFIEHFALPGFRMRVRQVEPCERTGQRSDPHLSYLVTDPEGNDDWLCGWDVRAVS